MSFLVATPENGADSIALSYALLGPFMTIVRPIAAIFSAILAGTLTWLTSSEKAEVIAEPATTKPATAEPATSCCSSTSCCSADGIAEKTTPPGSQKNKLYQAIDFAIDDLFRDIALWLGVGLVLAAAVNTFISPGAISQWSSGIGAMLLMLVIGVPMYTCATASTPLAAAMLVAGVSPGTTLVFLLAGPATNIGTIFIIKRELGLRTCVSYLAGVCGGALLTGLLVDWIVSRWEISVYAQVADFNDIVPPWLAISSLIILLLLTIKLYAGQLLGTKKACCS